VRLMNREVPSLGAVRLPALPSADLYERRALFGEDKRDYEKREGASNETLRERREQLSTVVGWRDGKPRPGDIRRCRHARCSRFLLVRPSRRKRMYCSAKCSGNARASRSMNRKIAEERAGKLERVRVAAESFRGSPNWKELTARRAGVTPNFITYAIRRGEIVARMPQ
jgi:hypothetical protein